MKQYLTPEQTAKLIELGLPKPKMAAPALKWVDGEPTFEPQYTIGELIEMLPGRINGIDLTIDRYYAFEQWHIYYDVSQYFTKQTELIDALYDMIVKLKDDGVI